MAGRTLARAERLNAVLGEGASLATLSSRTFFTSTARRRAGRWQGIDRVRRWLVRTVPVLAAATAIYLGAALGSGALTAKGRYQRQLTALEAPTRTFTVPEVANHPGAVAGVERRHLIRQFIALDGAN